MTQPLSPAQWQALRHLSGGRPINQGKGSAATLDALKSRKLIYKSLGTWRLTFAGMSVLEQKK